MIPETVLSGKWNTLSAERNVALNTIIHLWIGLNILRIYAFAHSTSAFG